MIIPHDAPREVWTGARDIYPLAAGVAIYGLAFGLLAAHAGFGTLQVGVMGAMYLPEAHRSSRLNSWSQMLGPLRR